MTDAMTIEEIETRLDKLADEKKQVDGLRDSFAAARDALGEIQHHPLVDSEGAARVGVLEDMLRLIGHHDITPGEQIYWERSHLREALREKETEKRQGER